MTTTLPALPANFAAALELIDKAHAEDPRSVPGADGGGGTTVPHELDYARKMTRWLSARCPDASPTLQLACRAQHFRRWEIPRDSFPMTRAGYLTWRAKQKAQAAERIKALLSSSTSSSPPPLLPAEDVDRVAALVRKENLAADAETQALEDVACLVFLDDQLDDFGRRDDVDEDKMLGILRKTWAKMSPRGRELALAMDLSERGKTLVGKALAG
ncbi:putative glutamyl-tRNA synthetase [Rosellinia necatrix]|uniref:Putative glutamyl-tRNA synthetase n=1 Tax=Rosellinia necatrix TaxID=77044 RepID=A0A1W2TLD7_ROSNE|nr:putative glutamyl-tRNA synthetase [Rosellinia necatrix]